MSRVLWVGILMLISVSGYADCQSERVKVQVLGSGGPEMDDGRASSSYLIWLDNKATILLDAGSGSSFNYEKSGAKPNDLKIVLFSHLHVDHSIEFPAYIKGFFFTGRKQDLLVFGPTGNSLLPATTAFVDKFFAKKGVYPYLNEYINSGKRSAYKVKATDIDVKKKVVTQVFKDSDFQISAVPVHHGPLPALAWRIDIAGCKLAFSGDMNNRYNTLVKIAAEADLLVAHLAIPEQATGVARKLHMPPSVIGKIAGEAHVDKLILSHRMKRTLGKEGEARQLIRKSYQGPIFFSDDLDFFYPDAL